MLYPIVIPEEGGYTGWVNTADIYAALAEKMRQKITELEVVLSSALTQVNSNNKTSKWNQLKKGQDDKALTVFPEVIHPLVYTHPITGRCVLNVSPLFAKQIVGLEPQESDNLLEELQAFATQKKFIYLHKWQVNDLIIWDNFQTMHRAYGCKKKYERVMYRTTISGVTTLEACV